MNVLIRIQLTRMNVVRLLALLVIAPMTVLAQTTSAQLVGMITDPEGLTVANAAVVAQQLATQARFSAVSGPAGQYRLAALPVGTYSVTVDRDGFKTHRQMALELHTGDSLAWNVQLEIGVRPESVEVSGNTPLLQQATGNVSMTVGRDSLNTLPLDGRNFIPLLTLAPGVALPSGGSLLARINGSRPRTNEYLYDGISALQPEPGQVVFYPVVDSIEEFRINLNSYAPDYGRSNGGAVIVTTRSGTNQVHGTLFEYFRNEALNARNYFAQPGAKPEFRRNQFGAAGGGPVRRNRTFFFADWQSTQLRTAVTRFSTVPTAAQHAGTFAASTPIYDPAAPGQTFPGNAIPLSRYDAVGTAGLNLYPVANLPGTANNYVRLGVEPDSQLQYDLKGDHYVNDRQRLWGRFSYFHDDNTPVTPLPDGGGSISSGVISKTLTSGLQAAGEHTWTLSPALLNQLRVGYTRRHSDGASPTNTALQIPNLPANGLRGISPTFAVAGFQQIGPSSGANSDFATSVTELVDTFSWNKGRHAFRFGTDLRREALGILQPANPSGLYTINTTGTNRAGVTSGNAVASLILGQVSAFSIDIQRKPLQERAHIAEFFANDDWRISDRLTVNIGTRYTLNFPSTETTNQTAIFNLNTQVLDFPHTGRDLALTDFGPRLGVAWRPTNSMVVRSGYGVVVFEQTGITTPFTLPQFPFVQTLGKQTQDNVTAAFTLSAGPGITVTEPNPNSGLGQGVFGTDRKVGSGYSQQWNLTLQKTFGANTSLEAAYVGSKNTHLGLPEANLNQLPAASLALGAALLDKVPNPYYGQLPASSSLNTATIARQQLLRAYPRFTNVVLFRDNVADSAYESAQVRLERRISKGLTATFAYTFSKLIDNASTYFSQTIFTGPVLSTTGAADAFNRKLERDISTGDIPHVFSASWMYEIPRVWKVSGWRIGGLVRLQSGDAVAISQATNNNASLGYALQRPNRLANPNLYATRSAARWFDTAAFSTAQQFTIGTSSRNPIRGPGLQNADLVVAKEFRLAEHARLEFRAEAFNVSNTPPLGDPNGSFGSAAFGTITTTGNPRDFEFVLKIHY